MDMDKSELLRRLADQPQTVAPEAVMELGDEAIPALHEVLHAGKPAQRAYAAELLRQLGEPGIAALQEALEAGDSPDATAAALGHDGAAGIRVLRSALHHPRVAVRLAALAGLVEAGLDATPAIPAISAALADRDSRVRLAAADALGTLAVIGATGNHAPMIIPALMILLDDKPELAETAAGTLAALGAAAIPTLVAALGSEEESLRIGAAMALALVNDPGLLNPALLALRTALQDPLDEVRYWAALALGDANAPNVIPDLERAKAAETDERAREAMQEALVRLGNDILQ